MKLYVIETNEKIIEFQGVGYRFNHMANAWHFLGSRGSGEQDELVVKDSQLQHFRATELPETPNADVHE